MTNAVGRWRINGRPSLGTVGSEYDFDHWEGACAGQSYTCTVTVSQALSIRAVFVKVGNTGP